MATRTRDFVDDQGIRWHVREITNATMPASLEKLVGQERRRTGWLVFESSDGERRRLSPYPADWTTVTDFEMARWCARAVRVPPAPGRRDQDQTES